MARSLLHWHAWGVAWLAATLITLPACDRTATKANSMPSLQSRLQPLRDVIYDDDAMFSGSRMSADLQALAPLAQQPGTPPEQVFLWHHAQASVYARRDMPEEAAEAAKRALQMADPLPVLTHSDERRFLRLSLARWLTDAQKLDEALQVAQALTRSLPLSPTACPPATVDQISPEQRLGAHEDLGYIQHERGNYAQALQTNLALLGTARQCIQAASLRPLALRGVLNNIAQNHHAMGQLAEAEPYLLERLQITSDAKDEASAFDTLFQLIVLSHERGEAAQANAWLERYEQRARVLNDAEHMAQAKTLRQQVSQRRARGG